MQARGGGLHSFAASELGTLSSAEAVQATQCLCLLNQPELESSSLPWLRATSREAACDLHGWPASGRRWLQAERASRFLCPWSVPGTQGHMLVAERAGRLTWVCISEFYCSPENFSGALQIPSEREPVSELQLLIFHI